MDEEFTSRLPNTLDHLMPRTMIDLKMILVGFFLVSAIIAFVITMYIAISDSAPQMKNQIKPRNVPLSDTIPTSKKPIIVDAKEDKSSTSSLTSVLLAGSLRSVSYLHSIFLSQ